MRCILGPRRSNDSRRISGRLAAFDSSLPLRRSIDRQAQATLHSFYRSARQMPIAICGNCRFEDSEFPSALRDWLSPCARRVPFKAQSARTLDDILITGSRQEK
jgi:hypothetical protein